MKIRLVVFIAYVNLLTDRQTDKRTDRQTKSSSKTTSLAGVINTI